VRIPEKRRWIDLSGLGWAGGEFGLACYAGLSTIYLLYFATEVLRIPPAWAGLALLVPRIWNMVADPIVGVLSDRTRTRFGRRRPYLLGGAVLWGICVALLFNLPPVHPPLAATLLFALVFLLSNTGLTLYQVPYAAMLAEISRDQTQRTRMVALREMVARGSILLTLGGGPWILSMAPTQSEGFGRMGVVFGAAIMAAGMLAFVMTAGAETAEPAGEVPRSGDFRAQMTALAHNRPLLWVSGSFLLVNTGDAVFSGSLMYFVTRVLGRSPALIGALYPMSSIAGIITAPLWSTAANRFGKVRMCRIALGGNALCCLLPLAISGHPQALYPFMVLYGVFNTGARLLPNAMVPDTADLDRTRTGERREGVIFGIFVFMQQTGFALGGFMLGLFLSTGTGGGAHSGVGGPSVFGIWLSFTAGAAALYGAALVLTAWYRIADTAFGAAAP
jgi:Na+/melibiose symporter-like transporter